MLMYVLIFVFSLVIDRIKPLDVETPADEQFLQVYQKRILKILFIDFDSH